MKKISNKRPFFSQGKHSDGADINAHVSIIQAVKVGKWPTKISLLISGFGNLFYGQTFKGLIFIITQALIWLFFSVFGWSYLSKFNTLGTQLMDKVYDPVNDLWVNVLGDNSLKILLFSILTIIILLFGVALQIASVKSSYLAEIAISKGKKPTTIQEDFKNMFDKNLHTTMLSLPALGVVAFTLLPIIFMILMAFTNFDRYHQPPGNLFTWVGFNNFASMIDLNGTKGSTFFGVLGWTLTWAVFATFGNYLLGMIIALLINKKGIKLKSLWRTCLVIVIAIPGFVTLLFMRQLLSEMGAVNTILNMLKMPSVKFLSNTDNARLTVILVNYWIGIPYTMLITSGILMNIPADLYEAAQIDGAGPVKQFTAITLPYMLTVTTPYLITQFVANINNFNAIYFLTLGEPPVTHYYNAGMTDLLITWLYKLTVNFGDYNLASVIGIIVFVLCGVISLITFNITSSTKKEEALQ